MALQDGSTPNRGYDTFRRARPPLPGGGHRTRTTSMRAAAAAGSDDRCRRRRWAVAAVGVLASEPDMTDPGGGFGWRSATTPYGRAAALADRVSTDELPPIAVLLLPRELERFILRDQAEDLLTAPGVVAVEPARISYGAYLRMPAAVVDGLAATQARRLKLPGVPRAIVIFHPLQYPLARALVAAHPDAQLWYWRWDRYESAYDANKRQRARLAELHMAASLRATVNVVVSDALGELAAAD